MERTSSRRGLRNEDGTAAPVFTVVRGDQSTQRTAPSILRFGSFELATESGELTREGQPVKLQPQPAKLLQYLAERPGQTVSRSDLQAHLWGENRFVDSEQGLNYCIKSIRRALGDSAENPTYLETIPRRGYRFRAPVETVDGPTPRPVAPTLAPAQGSEPSSRRWLLALPLLVAIAVAGWLLWRFAIGSDDRPPRIVVLPFENLSERPADGPLATGLAAELISHLVREHGRELGVIAQASAMAYAETRAPIARIGSELDVDLLLTGVVQRTGETLRISTELIEVDSETVRWAEVSELREGGTHLTAWTTEVSAAVASELGLESSRPGVPAFELAPELYEVYLQGISFANLKTPEGVQLGLETLAEVRRRAPGFAPAHLAWARLRIRSGSPKEVLPEVMATLEKAIELDPDFAEAHLEITRLRGLYLYEWRRGAEHVRRALELRPRLADAHIVHAMYLGAAGRVDEAIDAMHQALVIDPLSQATSAHMAWSYFFARRFDRAIDVSRRTLELDPESIAAHTTIIHSLIQLDDPESALAQAEKMADRDFSTLEDFWRFRIEQGQASSGVLAIWQTQLGEHKAALDSLLQACDEQVGWPLPFLRVDARFDSLRQHPRFNEVLDCTGLAG